MLCIHLIPFQTSQQLYGSISFTIKFIQQQFKPIKLTPMKIKLISKYSKHIMHIFNICAPQNLATTWLEFIYNQIQTTKIGPLFK